MNELFGTLIGGTYGGVPQLSSQQTALEIEARRQAQYEQLQKILLEKQDEAAWKKAMKNQGVLGNPYNGPLGQPYENIFAARPQVMHPDPNTMPEMQMSLETAYNMWLVRFGDMWVKSEDVQDADGFRWPLVASRLRDMRLVEVSTLSNHHRLVPHVRK